MIVFDVLRCEPISWFWMRVTFNPHRAVNPSAGMCDPQHVVRMMQVESVLAAVTDFGFASLPLFIMRDVNLRRMERIALWAVIFLAEL